MEDRYKLKIKIFKTVVICKLVKMKEHNTLAIRHPKHDDPT